MVYTISESAIDGAAHAFRHGNATLLDSLHAPMAVRQERLGHVDERTTMGYTHVVTADDVRVAAELGALLDKEFLVKECLNSLQTQKQPPKSYRKPFRISSFLVAGAGFEPATFGL
jgi:hypothetical protein